MKVALFLVGYVVIGVLLIWGMASLVWGIQNWKNRKD